MPDVESIKEEYRRRVYNTGHTWLCLMCRSTNQSDIEHCIKCNYPRRVHTSIKDVFCGSKGDVTFEERIHLISCGDCLDKWRSLTEDEQISHLSVFEPSAYDEVK